MKRRCLVGIAGLMGLGVATFIRHPLTLFSNELNQPTINTLVSQTKGQGAYLNWSVPIPESNIFLSEDFESLGLDLSQNILSGTSVSYYGWKTDPYGVERPVDDPVRNSVKIISGVGVNGSNGLLAAQTTPGQGWNYTFRPNLPIPNGGSDVSSVNILGWKQLQAGEPAVVQFLAKGSGTLSIHLQSGWTGSSLPLGHEITWAESLSAEEFEARLKTNQPIKIHNPLEKTLNYTLHLATAFCEDYSYNFKLSLGVIEKQGEDWVYQPLEWHGAWKDKVRPGQLVTPDELRQVDSIQAGDFLYEIQSNKGASAKISIAAEEWTPYAMNIEIPSTQTALDLGSYYYLELASETTAQFQVDNLEFAYAPKSRLYRDGALILDTTRGVEFTDSEAKDLEAPKAVDESLIEISAEVLKDTANYQREVTFHWEAVEDLGTTYHYQVSSVDEAGAEVAWSPEKSLEVVSGLKGYSVVIDHNPDTEPGNQVTTTDLSASYLANSGKPTYLHIKAIDEAGNASKTVHIKEVIAPEIRSEMTDNKYLTTNWAVDLLEENVLWRFDYEEDEQSLINLVYNKNNGAGAGGQFFDSTNYYSGERSVFTPETSPDQGNNFYPPEYTESDYNHIFYNKRLGLRNNSAIVASFRMKASDYATVHLFTGREKIESFYYYDSYYLEDYPAGSTELKVSNMNVFKLRDPITFDSTPGPDKEDNFITSIDEINKTITLSKPIGTAVKAGDQVKCYVESTMINFPSIATSGTDGWELFNVSATVSNPSNFNWEEHPVILRQQWKTNGDTWMDDLVVGYATKSRLYRDGVAVYEGYEAQFADTKATDKVAPASIDLHQVETEVILKEAGTPTRQVNLSWENPLDRGTEYTYQVAMLDYQNQEVNHSKALVKEMVSGIKGYSVVLDTKPTTIPNTSIDTTEPTFTGELADSQTYYLHIRAIDYAGNASETTHIEIPYIEFEVEASTDLENPNQYEQPGKILTWSSLPDYHYNVYRALKSENSDDVSFEKVIETTETSISGFSEDLTPPELPEIGRVTHQEEESVIHLKPTSDQGNTYLYAIEGVHADGKQRFVSTPLEDGVVSGFAGYSYVIDQKSGTEPGDDINLTEATITHQPTNKKPYYLHIKAIDVAGNVSDTQHLEIESPTLELVATSNPDQNMIRLDWTNKPYHTYKVYQRREGASEFQSISLTNLEEGTQVKVLNLYPYSKTSSYPVTGEISFTTWKGESYTLPASASLKMWMETPTPDYPKGYGMGLIEVTPLDQTKFNRNPEAYLKNPDGTWKYDVIVNGFWDDNSGVDYTSESVELIRAFIKSGKGYLFGHDTINGNPGSSGRKTNLLRDLVNVKFVTDFTPAGELFPMLFSSETQLLREGALLQYPHEIGEVGEILSIPRTHSTRQLAYGDVWMSLHGEGSTSGPDGLGTNNHYLTSWNNTALIQTGHSRGQATFDEQKILANTIFYLYQLSGLNYLNDYSGRDVAAPDTPLILSTDRSESGVMTLTLDAINDNGTTYEYYVQAFHEMDDSVLTSDIVSETITTGAAGFSYVIDSQAETIPDQTVDLLSGQSLVVSPEHQGKYLHIKSLDKAGNASETLHYKLPDPVILSLTVPSAPLSFVLNPNAEAGQIFQAPTFELVNDGNVSLAVELATFEQTSTVFNDVPPSKHSDWGILDQAASRDFALGLYPTRLTANGSENLTPIYVSGFQPLRLGELHPGERMNFEFQAHHGLSFKTPLTPSYRLTFIYEALTH